MSQLTPKGAAVALRVWARSAAAPSELKTSQVLEWLEIIDLACDQASKEAPTIPMRITCPECSELHLDEGEFATKPHHTHSCQGCGLTWRPALGATVGVRFLPGFKNTQP